MYSNANFMGDSITKLRWLINFFVWSKLWRLRISYKKCVFFHPRTVQLTVSNALVGRIIGRGGMKINSIQVREYMYIIYVCNRSLFHALMFRTFLSMIQCCSQLLRILKGWWLKDQSVIVVLKTTSNTTEVRKEGGCPPFHFLATTLVS